MPQLEGKKVRAWLASSAAKPDLLLGLEVDHQREETGGRISEASRSGLAIQTPGGLLRIHNTSLDQYIIQGVPSAIMDLMTRDLKGVPVDVLQTVKECGFDVEPLPSSQINAAYALIDAARNRREAGFDVIEEAGNLLALPNQENAALKLFQAIMEGAALASAGQARIKLAAHANRKRKNSAVLTLTNPALRQNSPTSSLSRQARGILLNIRASSLARAAFTCRGMAEAADVLDEAMAILGRTQQLVRTREFLEKRKTRLGCGC
jgi:hypothetical protein